MDLSFGCRFFDLVQMLKGAGEVMGCGGLSSWLMGCTTPPPRSGRTLRAPSAKSGMEVLGKEGESPLL